MTEEELARLQKIEALAAKCLYNSSGFCSAWEFDHGVDAEELWDKLAALLDAGSYKVFCGRCGARLDHGSHAAHEGKVICLTCLRELNPQGLNPQGR